MVEIFIERAISFGLFWGMWLLVPLLIDISTAIIYFINFAAGNDENDRLIALSYKPYITIVIPVHNSADTLATCLESLLNQTYPVEFMEVICVNNGSSDNSFGVFQEFQLKHPNMQVMWTTLERAGKSIALNAGIYSGRGTYLVNVDADVWLERNAILNTVRYFESDPTLVAATGSIRVDKILGVNSKFIDIINYCEVIEYLVAFDVGRRYQNMKNCLFTLSGAFSAFRRQILLESFMYQERTVSEDTDLTFSIRKAIENKGRIGYMSQVIAYVEPTESLSRLYSQRVRWQRGEMEVMGVYYDHIPNFIRALQDFRGRILLSDHTLSFLRLSWTFLLPFLYFIGYPLPTIIVAIIGLFGCYMVLEICNFFVAYRTSAPEYKKELKKI